MVTVTGRDDFFLLAPRGPVKVIEARTGRLERSIQVAEAPSPLCEKCPRHPEPKAMALSALDVPQLAAQASARC